MSKKHSSDRFPYELEFKAFKISQDNVLVKTADDYCDKLALFFEEISLRNIIFSKTNDITKVSLSDIDDYFYQISSKVSPRTYNNFHKVINQYFRF